MKEIVKNYTINKALRQITLTDYSNLDIEQILIITDVATNEMIYNFADPVIGGTISNNVLTLDYDMTGVSDTDNLQIWIYNYNKTLATNEMQETLKQLTQVVLLMRKQLEALTRVDTSGRLVVNAENTVITSGTVTTVSTVSNLSTLNGIDTRYTEGHLESTRANQLYSLALFN